MPRARKKVKSKNSKVKIVVMFCATQGSRRNTGIFINQSGD